MEERRKSGRFLIPLDVEFIPSNETSDYVLGEIRDFSPEGFSIEAKNIDLGTDKIIKTRFKLLPESKYINVLGKIVWMIQFGDDCQIGIEIKEIESEINSENLGYPFNIWMDKINKKQKE